MKKDYSKHFNRPVLRDARKRLNKETKIINYSLDDKFKNIGLNKTYYIHTYGCQANEADTEKIIGILEELGFKKAVLEKDADIIIFNTCAIRENAENRAYGNIGRVKIYKRTNPNLIIAMCGCMPQEEKVINKILKSYPYVDLIFGTHNIYKLPQYIKNTIYDKERVLEVFSEEGNIYENMPKKRANGKKAWVSIMYGCDEFCTYCIVPYVRGKERSRKAEYILEEIEQLYNEGYQEITLLGQNVNSYGRDFTDISYKFSDLLREVAKIDIPRIRFTTSHPKDFDDSLIEVLSEGGNLMPHIHLPVQSGNTEVLKKMNRKYTREQYLTLVEKIYKKIPEASITTDIIVGFPGETEEQFLDTLSLVEKCKFEGGFTFVFSKREGTPAYNYEDVCTEEEKKQRLYKLNKIINDGFATGNARFLNKKVKVLVDGYSKHDKNVLMGYTEHNKVVNFKGDSKYIGKIVDVLITEYKTWFLLGKIVNE